LFDLPPMMFMVVDMERMSGDPRLRQLLDGYSHSRAATDPRRPFRAVWARMLDPQAPVPTMNLTGSRQATCWRPSGTPTQLRLTVC
jgi:hypothetical protein